MAARVAQNVFQNVFRNTFSNVFVVGGDPRTAFAANGFTPDIVISPRTNQYLGAAGALTFADFLAYAGASSRTFLDSSGVIQTVSSGVARTANFFWNGSAFEGPNQLVEPKISINLLLNTGTLSTQNVTVAAVAQTLHFTGTGTVTLTGTSTAGPLVGTGTGEDNRVNLVFTPTAGTLTLTVSGTVTNAKLEVGQVPTSYIESGGSQATRALETLEITVAALAREILAATGSSAMPAAVTIQVSGTTSYADQNLAFQLRPYGWTADGSNSITTGWQTNSGTGQIAVLQQESGATDFVQSTGSVYAPGQHVIFNWSSRHGATFINAAHEGNLLTQDNPTALADLTSAAFDLALVGDVFDLSLIRIWFQDIGDTGITEAST